MKCQKNFELSAWAQKIRDNPQFYEFFRQKIAKYVENNP